MGIFKDKWVEGLMKSSTPRHTDNQSQRQRDSSEGLGDTIKKLTSALGIEPCEGCRKRADKLNQRFPYNRNK